MAFNSVSSAVPREEIARVIMEGASLNRELIWDKVLPPLGLDNFTAHLPKLSIAGAELMRIIPELTAPGANIPRMNATIGDFTFNPAIRKQEIGIPVEEGMKYEQVFSLVMFYSQQLGNKMLSLTLEYLAAQALFNTTNFGAATNGAVAYTTANLATIRLIADIYAAIERGRDAGEQYDTVIIPSRVWMLVRQSALLKDFLRGSLAPGAEVTVNVLQQALADEGITQVLIGRAQYNTAASGGKTLSRVWSDTYIWVGRAGYKNENTDDGVPIIDGVGATAFWKPYGLMMGETYEDKVKEQEVVRGKTSGNPTIFNPNSGTLIATQYSL